MPPSEPGVRESLPIQQEPEQVSVHEEVQEELLDVEKLADDLLM